MKYIIPAILICFIFGCSPDDPEPASTIESVTPDRIQIGDTITIAGSGLGKISNIYFNHKDRNFEAHDVRVTSFISKTEQEIKVIVPILVHENVYIHTPQTNNYDLELYGFLKLSHRFVDPQALQILDENTAFVIDQWKVYKSTDGWYTWSLLDFTTNKISSCFFLDENLGWFGVMELPGISIYETQDGGKTATVKFQIDPNGEWDERVRKIQLLSPTKGFFGDGHYNVYRIDGNSWNDVYELYPDMKDLPGGQVEIWDFNAVDEDLFFLSPNGNRYLIKVDHSVVSSTSFDIWPSHAPRFHGSTAFLQVNSDIYKTTDSGGAWIRIKTFENHFPEIYFLSAQKGFAFVNYTPRKMYRTLDGGATWQIHFTFPHDHNNNLRDFNSGKGLIISSLGKTLKYIE
jgi:hypothetical protein